MTTLTTKQTQFSPQIPTLKGQVLLIHVQLFLMISFN